MIIVDTNVVSEMMKAEMDPAPRDWVTRQSVSSLWLSVITVAELRFGAAIVADGTRKARLHVEIERLIAEDFGGRVLDFSEEATIAYAEIGARCRRVGRMMQPMDLQIAAIAHFHGAAIATRNVRHFEQSGAEIIDPWSF